MSHPRSQRASLALCLLVASTTCAADSPIPDSLSVCINIRSDPERLACYDQAMARIASGSLDQHLPEVSPQAVFGTPANSGRQAGEREALQRQELRSIQARVTALRGSLEHGLHVELDNGQVWLQKGGADLVLKPGDAVTISRAALDTFKLSTATGRYARVRRVR